jgi:hypothetical protein
MTTVYARRESVLCQNSVYIFGIMRTRARLRRSLQELVYFPHIK